MSRTLQALFFLLIVRPFLALVLGVNLRHAERLPRTGPAILAANHNSHLDTLLLMSLFPVSQLHRVRPVAAADYFLKNRFIAWFALNIMHILPLARRPKPGEPPLAHIEAALVAGDILILFPEGSRGEPEKRSALKSGIAHLMADAPTVPVIPVYLHGLGKALPKGDWLPIPFFADGFVGEPLVWQGDRAATMQALEARFAGLEQKVSHVAWE
ncbi:MAG: lysophospholipid acyltransferase family protein [Thiobacillus sp.]